MSYTEFHINTVYLMLGGKCNYQCRHCIQCQSVIAENGAVDKSLSYIRHLANIRPPKIGKLTVMFWGGEPLLYFETIKRIVDKLDGVVDYAMVSNGSLLTGEIVEFCNEHNLCYILSNDGVNTKKVRGDNLVENKSFLDLFLRLKNRAIDAVITAYNQDYYKLWEYIDRKVPNTRIYTELLECTWDMPEDLYDFDFEAYEDMMQRIMRKAHDDLLKGEGTREVVLLKPYTSDVMRIVQKSSKGEDVFFPYSRCRQMRRCVNIDLDGNVYACHNFSDKIGTVSDDYETLLDRYDSRYELKETCKNCEALLICRGGCPYARSKGEEKCCKIRRIFIRTCLNLVSSFADTLEEVEL